MNYFSIKDMEALTGIKPHTIRVWEQRYRLIAPKRTPTNIRYYDDNDLRILLNISLLNRLGYKISKISRLSSAQIDQIILEQCNCCEQSNFQVHALMGCMLSFDEHAFNKILNTHIEKTGLKQTMCELVFPFLHHIGLLWMAGSINSAFEHFVSHIIKTKLFAAIDQLGHTPCHQKTKKVLLFLPEGETHEIGLLFGNYLIRSQGHQSVYLGQSLPDKDLDIALHTFKPQYIFTSVLCGVGPVKLQSWINNLSSRFPDKIILVTGKGFLTGNIELPSNAVFIKTPLCMETLLEA